MENRKIGSFENKSAADEAVNIVISFRSGGRKDGEMNTVTEFLDEGD